MRVTETRGQESKKSLFQAVRHSALKQHLYFSLVLRNRSYGCKISPEILYWKIACSIL